MKQATKEQVEQWKVKYGQRLTHWFADVLAGKSTLTELAERMNLSKEGARKYFYRYYSEEELVGTKYEKTTGSQGLSSSVTVDSDDLTTIIDEVVRQVVDRLSKQIKELMVSRQLEDNPLDNQSKRNSYQLTDKDSNKLDKRFDSIDWMLDKISDKIDDATGR